MAGGRKSEAVLECPRCGTRYRAPGAILSRPDSTYRCSRCEHVFSLAPAADAGESEAFSFDLDDEPTADEEFSPAPASGADTPAFVHQAIDAEESSLHLPPEPAFTASASEGRHAGETRMASPRTWSWLRIGVRVEACVLVVFGAIGLYLLTYPREALNLVERLPFVEETLGTSSYLLDQIYVTDLRGTYERLKEDRPAFVIVGKVINEASGPVGAIQVEGRLYGETSEAARKTVFAGTKASWQLVKGWSAAEIDMLEKIKPPKRYRLAPGASDNFLIIFPAAPAGLREFGCRVVSAQPVASTY